MISPRTASRLLALEGGLGLAWTAALFAQEGLASLFLPPDVPTDLIRTFVIADVAFYVALPFVAASGFATNAPWARGALTLHVGGAAYALLWGVGLVAATSHGALATALMAAPVLVGSWLLLRTTA